VNSTYRSSVIVLPKPFLTCQRSRNKSWAQTEHTEPSRRSRLRAILATFYSQLCIRRGNLAGLRLDDIRTLERRTIHDPVGQGEEKTEIIPIGKTSVVHWDHRLHRIPLAANSSGSTNDAVPGPRRPNRSTRQPHEYVRRYIRRQRHRQTRFLPSVLILRWPH